MIALYKSLQGLVVSLKTWKAVLATFLAHSKNELIQWRAVRRLSVCLSVCKLLRKSLLLADKWPDRDQTCTRWSPGKRASRVCSRSRSKVTWYGHFCAGTKIATSPREMAGSWPNLHRMVSRWTCIQGVLKVKVKGHVIRTLSWILVMSYSVIDGLVLHWTQRIILYNTVLSRMMSKCVMYTGGLATLLARGFTRSHFSQAIPSLSFPPFPSYSAPFRSLPFPFPCFPFHFLPLEVGPLNTARGLGSAVSSSIGICGGAPAEI